MQLLYFWSASSKRVCQNQDCFLLYNLFKIVLVFHTTQEEWRTLLPIKSMHNYYMYD